MSKKKRTEVIVVCMMAISIIVGITAFPLACVPTEPLVTGDCTDQTTNSLTAHATVNSLEAGTLSRRGFVFAEGTEGDTAHNLTSIPLVNPSFEEGDPPTGWIPYNATPASESSIVKEGAKSLKLTSTGTWGQLRQSVLNPGDYSGEVLTVGAWVRASSANDQESALWIGDQVEGSWAGTRSEYIPKDDTWHWVTVSRTIRDGAPSVQLRLHVNFTSTADYDDVVYWDGAFLAQNAVFEDGEFGTGTYSLVITGLKPDTSYRVRAFVGDMAGISYGNTVTCRTLP